MKAAFTALVCMAALASSVEAKKDKKKNRGPQYACNFVPGANTDLDVTGNMRFFEKTKKGETHIKQRGKVKGLDEGCDYEICLSEDNEFVKQDQVDLKVGAATCEDLAARMDDPTIFGEFTGNNKGAGKVKSNCINRDYMGDHDDGM